MSDLGPTAELARLRGLRDEFIAVVDEITAARDETSARAPIARLRRLFDEISADGDAIIAAIERGLTVEAVAEAAEDDLWRDTATISQLFNISGNTVRDLCENQVWGKNVAGVGGDICEHSRARGSN